MIQRVFIGYDQRESAAFHVLSSSILRRSSAPIAVAPVGNAVLPKSIWTRPRAWLCWRAGALI